MQLIFGDSVIAIIAALVLVVGLALTLAMWLLTWTPGLKSSVEILLRSISISALILLCAAPQLEQASGRAPALLLLDISDSVDQGIGEQLLAKVREFVASGIEVRMLAFAKNSAKDPVLLDKSSYREIRESDARLDIGGTNISTAFEQALTDQSGAILLVSDGFETSGDITSLLPAIKGANRKIFPLLPASLPQGAGQFRVSQLFAPLVSPAQTKPVVRVSVQNSTAQAQRGRLKVQHDKAQIFDQTIEVAAGEERVFEVEGEANTEGIKAVTATLEPEGGFGSSAETVFVSGEQREKVLLLTAVQEDERLLKQVLNEQAYQLKSQNPRTEGIPDLAGFSVVILNNVPRADLGAAGMQKITEFVKRGGGAIMIGGDRSFGLGGYIDTPIADMLPVELVPPQTEKKRLNVAVQLVIDKSRSMATDDKIEFVKDAAREVIKSLKDEDFVGIIGFDATPFIVVRLAQLATSRDQAMDRVGRIFASGRTNLMPAIDEARRALDRVQAGRKHMIILTDGKIPDEGPFYLQLTDQLRVSGITTSTVMLGDESDIGMLRDMAKRGGGSFYQTADANALPRIFLQDIKVSSGEQTLKEKQEYSVRQGPDQIQSTQARGFPSLKGYVQTKARSGAALELIVLADEKAEPLLASWKYGQGRSIAFTSDANGRWSSYWPGWNGFRRFWTDLVDSARAADAITQEERIKFDLRVALEHGELDFDLSIFTDIGGAQPSATIKFPDGSTKEVGFEQINRGYFKASLPKAIAGRYEVSARVGARVLTPVAFNVSGESFGEKKGRGFNTALLERLASSTLGAINPDSAKVRESLREEKQIRDLAIPLFALALIAFLLEVIVREFVRSRRTVYAKARLIN